MYGGQRSGQQPRVGGPGFNLLAAFSSKADSRTVRSVRETSLQIPHCTMVASQICSGNMLPATRVPATSSLASSSGNRRSAQAQRRLQALPKQVTAIASPPAPMDVERSEAKTDSLPVEHLPHPKSDPDSLEQDMLSKVAYTIGANPKSLTARQAYRGLAWTVRERLIDAFNKTQEYWK